MPYPPRPPRLSWHLDPAAPMTPEGLADAQHRYASTVSPYATVPEAEAHARRFGLKLGRR
ncbi:hypothetical protein [Tsukamurella soli]|uniref:Uncharacterized protein n=1 Tax=Tsukamurella soli TaxID=644556 RepID=A0ABP8KC12_9ACTN